MAGFFNELKRRSVIKVAIVYGAVAWVVIQIADSTFSSLNLPDWAETFVIVIAGIGFPIALVLAWAFDLTPNGVIRTPAENDSEAVVKAAPSDVDDKSIAVLPFVNMSADQETEYFSDGVSEEILNVLVAIPELRVAARTSSFSFKGQNVDIRKIAGALNVANVLEGSVRKAGDQLRITAQLIEAESGYHLWSGTFDRKMENIFEVQDNIAQAISSALRLQLTGAADETPMIEARTSDLKAYDLYLRGRFEHEKRTPEGLKAAEKALEEAVALDPNFASAWGSLSWAYTEGALGWDASQPPRQRIDKAEKAIDRALAIDPDQYSALMSQAIIDGEFNHNWRKADEGFKISIALQPDDARARQFYAVQLGRQGRGDEAMEQARLAADSDPLSPVVGFTPLATLRVTRQLEKGYKEGRHVIARWPEFPLGLVLAGLTAIDVGKLDEAEGLLKQAEKYLSPGLPLMGMAKAQMLILKGDREAAKAIVDGFLEPNCKFFTPPALIASFFATLGDESAAAEWLDKACEEGDPHLLLPHLTEPLQESESFKAIYKRMGLA
jgi:adenylate cyclase